MIKKLIICILIIAGAIGLTHCQIKNEPLRIIRISEDVCALPCWMGITPGETSYKEAVKILESLDFFSRNGYILIKEDFGIDWYAGDGNRVKIMLTGGVVSNVFFEIGDTSLVDVIQKYGPPEYYTIVEDEGAYALDLFFPGTGFVFTAGQHYSKPILENMRVSRAQYLSPSSGELFLNEYINFLELIRPGTTSNYPYKNYPWEGFGVCPQGLRWADSCED